MTQSKDGPEADTAYVRNLLACLTIIDLAVPLDKVFARAVRDLSGSSDPDAQQLIEGLKTARDALGKLRQRLPAGTVTPPPRP